MPKPTAAVLWLHDQHERDATALSSLVTPHAPWLSFSCPSAPTYSWFDCQLPVLDVPSTTPRDLSEMTKQMHERLDYLERAMQLDSSRIVIGGFGQGGALAIAAGLTYHKPLAGIVSHSGWVAQPLTDLERLAKVSPNGVTPIMLIHGDDDECVTLAAARRTSCALLKAGFCGAILKTFEGVEHKMSEQTLGLLVDFLRTQLPLAAPISSKQQQQQQAATSAGAKSKTVITMARGRPGAAPGSHGASTAPTPAPVAPAQPRVPALAPVPAPAPAPVAGAAPMGASSASASALDALSPDPATALALQLGDRRGLEAAVARRTNEPIGQREMEAIAHLMLGNDLAKHSDDLAAFAQSQGAPPTTAAAAAMTTSKTAAAPVPTRTPSKYRAPLDSDDEEDEDDDREGGPPSDSGVGASSAAAQVEAAAAQTAAAETSARVAAAAAAARRLVEQAESPARMVTASNGAGAGEAATAAAETAPHSSSAGGFAAEGVEYEVVESHGEDDACGRGSLLLLVRLPAHGPAAMASMADLAVDLDSARVVVALAHAPGDAGGSSPPLLELHLLRPIDDVAARCRFSKARRELRITAPLI